MYKKRDQEYNKGQSSNNHSMQEHSETFAIKDSLKNAEENYKNHVNKINFPQVNYTYSEIPKAFYDKLLQFTDTQKLSEAFNSMMQREIQFENEIQKLKKRQYEFRMISQQALNNSVEIINNQSQKMGKLVNKLKNHLENYKNEQKKDLQNLQQNNKQKLINLDDFMANVFKVYKHLAHQKEKNISKMKNLKQLQVDFSNMSNMLIDSSQKSSIKQTQQKFIETKKAIQKQIDSQI